MIPFIVLTGVFIVLRVLGLAGIDALDDWQAALRGGLAVMFTLTGITHFLGARRRDFVAMVPPGWPRPELLVTVTGVLELAGAVGLLLPLTSPLAAVCLALLLVTMFPANVSAARRGLVLGGRPATSLPIRTALQIVFIAAAIGAAV